ncbi:MAG: DUF3108 domain-containing protein [Hyphomonadaceae bacterium]
MPLPKFAAALLCAIAVCLAQPARAESYRAEYEAAVLGAVVLGRATIAGASANGRYQSTATLRTSGLAALIDQTNITASATGLITPRGIAWTGYNLSHAYARKFRRVVMRRAGGGIQTTITPRFGDMGDPPATRAQQTGAYDPVSALFVLGRLVGQNRTCTGTVRVFDGRQLYRLSLLPRAVGTFRGGGYAGPAVSCTMRYTPMAGFRMSAAERARIPAATAWFTRPARVGQTALPLRVTVPTPVGAAQLEIRSFRYTP